MKGKVWKRIRGSENKNWGKKTSFSNVIPHLVTGLVFIIYRMTFIVGKPLQLHRKILINGMVAYFV